jgi:hypothetical protein
MMADRATSDRIAADMRPPDYRAAVKRIRGIVPKKAKIAGINGEISGIYDAIEGHKVDKRAARIFATLDAMDHEDRVMIFRGLNGLIDAAEWAPAQADIVDQAQGNVVTLRAGGRSQEAREGDDLDGRETNEAGEDVEIDETMKQVEGDTPPTAAEGSNNFLAAVAAQKARERTAAEGKKRGKPAEPEPYTGDNSDLAGGE